MVILIYVVKSGKSLVGDRGKKQSTYKGNDPLSFEMCIFRNGQPDRIVYFCSDDLNLGAAQPCFSSFFVSS